MKTAKAFLINLFIHIGLFYDFIIFNLLTTFSCLIFFLFSNSTKSLLIFFLVFAIDFFIIVIDHLAYSNKNSRSLVKYLNELNSKKGFSIVEHKLDDYLAHETISEINKLKFAHKKANQAICKILRIEYHENKIISQLKGFSIIFSLSKDTLFDFKYKYNSMIFIVDSPTQINDFGMFALLHEIGHTNRDSLFLGSTRKLFSSCICIFLIFQNSFWLVIGIFIILLINLPEVLLRNNETLKEINADIFSLSLIQKPQKGWAFLSEILSRNFNHSKFRLLFHDIIIKKRIEGEFGENLYRTFRVINLLDFFRSYNITMIKFLRPIFFFFAVYFLSICEVSVNFERNLVIALLIIVSEFIYNFIISITLNQQVKINLSKLSSIHN